jgi:AbrB family looped-hinge helix DNA binding protein
MIEEEMKVGPKGQVVIPRVFRKALKITPGSKVVFKLENERRIILEKSSFDAAAAFERIAKSGKSVSHISPHMYEEELEERVASTKQ